MEVYIGQQHETTPAHCYCGTNDLAAILDDIVKGNMPVGTGKPFPVNFDDPTETQTFTSPWEQKTAQLQALSPYGL